MRASLDKDRDMARSILPCKNRKPARVAKAKTKRAARHAVRRDLKAAAGLTDLDEWDDTADLRREPTAKIRMIVRWRRDGDKLNHFERWAIAVTRDIRHEDRLSAVAARLPRGLIGDHALTHLRHRPELNPNEPYRMWRLVWMRRHEDRDRAFQQERRELERLVRALVTSLGGHRQLNAAMKAIVRHPAGGQVRPPHLLLTPDDVESFVSGLYLPDRVDPLRHKQLNAVRELCREYRLG